MKKCVVDTSSVVGFLVRNENDLMLALKKFDEIILLTEVIFESVFVLEKEYGIDRKQIVDGFYNLLQTKQVSYDRKMILNTLLCYQKNTSLSVVDSYILVVAKEMDSEILTQDKKLKNVWQS